MFGQRGEAEEPESISVVDVELNHNRLSIASVGSTTEMPGSSGHQQSAGKGLGQYVADFDAEQEGIELGERPSAVSNTPRENHVVESGLEQQLAQAQSDLAAAKLLLDEASLLEIAAMTAEHDSTMRAIAERNARLEQNLIEGHIEENPVISGEPCDSSKLRRSKPRGNRDICMTLAGALAVVALLSTAVVVTVLTVRPDNAKGN
jgi:hypothetical protein